MIALQGLLLLLATTQVTAQSPAIIAEGTLAVVEGSDLEVRPFRGDPIRVVDLAATLSTVVAESADHETEVTAMMSRIAASESRAVVAESVVAELSSQLSDAVSTNTAMAGRLTDVEGSLRNAIGQQTARITAVDTSLRESVAETTLERAAIVASISALTAAMPNSSAVDALGTQLAALANLTERLRHPHRVVLYGALVRGDDAASRVDCPEGSGLSPESCEVERMPGDVTGPWATDGIEMRDTGCTGRAHVHGARIRAKLTCSDVHEETQIITDTEWRQRQAGQPLTLDCPEGLRALHCQCYSAWGNCEENAWGFSPLTLTQCAANDINGGPVKLSVICVNNA